MAGAVDLERGIQRVLHIGVAVLGQSKLTHRRTQCQRGLRGQALNVIENLQQSYGNQNVDVELVAFGLGIGILKLESVAGSRVQDALKSGARIVACEVTMRRQKLTKEDMLPNIGYVPGGVVEIIAKERQGWAVIRP